VISRSTFEVKQAPKIHLDYWCSYGFPPAKYEYKKYFDKRGVVAAKLGPSRSKQSLARGSSPARSISSSTLPPKPTTRSSSSQLTVDLPPRPASTVAQPTQAPVQPAAPRPASVWDDLMSLSTPSSNASLPLQYLANPTPAQPTIQPVTSFNTMNPYSNLVAAQGVQPQPSPMSQLTSLPPQQNPMMNVQTQGFNGGLQPSFGATQGFSIPQSNPFTPSTQPFSAGVGLNSMNSLQPSFSAPAFHNQTFLPQQTQTFPTQQYQQPGGGMVSANFPGQAQGFQQFTPGAGGNPFYAMQQQQLQQVQPTGYMSQQQQPFGMSPSPNNPFSQRMQPGNPFSPVQTPGWQNGGFPTQQQWG